MKKENNKRVVIFGIIVAVAIVSVVIAITFLGNKGIDNTISRKYIYRWRTSTRSAKRCITY